jgi:TIR domain
MALKWSCFLSFRGGKGDLALGIVDLFAKALTNELELQTDAGLYRYSDEMVAGDIIDPSIAGELKASACMIVLFTGKYFSKTKPYCTREYLAMTLLEKERLNLLPPDKRETKGLIVPVILRNPELFPPALKKRFWFDFTEFGQDDSGISKPKKFFADVRNIAEYAAARYYELDGVVDGAKAVKFPNEKQVFDFLAKLHNPQKTKTSKAARK